MRSMMIKDLTLLRKKSTAFYYLLLPIVCGVLIYSIGYGGILYCSFLLLYSCVNLPQMTIMEDTKADWDSYALALPIRSSEIVASKYLLSILAILSLTIVSLLINVAGNLYFKLFSFGEIILITYLMIFLSLVVLSLMIPLLYRFGNSAQFILIFLLVFGASTILGTVCSEGFAFPIITDSLLALGIIGSILLTGILLYVSYRISLSLYRSAHK